MTLEKHLISLMIVNKIKNFKRFMNGFGFLMDSYVVLQRFDQDL